MKKTAAVVLVGMGVICLGSLFGAGTADDKAGPKIITNSIGMKLAFIPTGKFLMGSPADEPERDPSEVQHEVTVTKAFYMGVHEVTQGQYLQVALIAKTKTRPIFDDKRGGSADHPMENVLWSDAVNFCNLLSAKADEKQAGRSYRLPTEAEWEYACRAGTTTTFHFGKTLSAKQANFNGNFPFAAEKGPYLRLTAKVGSYPPNAWGLCDMHGNVAEWCGDYFDKDYYKNSPKEDPKGPEKGVVADDYGDFFRVIRGGCWLDEGRACRSAYRYRAMPKEPNRLVGFRVVCEVAAKAP
jgi:sulfatase modifying factor 1